MPRLNKVAQWYTSAAIALLNTVVLFVAVNALLGAVMFVKDYGVGTNPSDGVYPEASMRKVYGAMSDEERQLLLDETWNRTLGYEQFVQLTERPFTGKYVNVNEHGFRFTPAQAPWPPDSANYNIFVIGGSTTFGYGVADGETIPAMLQGLLKDAGYAGRRVVVYNLGRGFFYSTVERILFEQLLQAGHRPNEVVFIDGLNDFYESDGVFEYTAQLTQFMTSNPSSPEAATTVLKAFQALPMGRAVSSVMRRASSPPREGGDTAAMQATIERYLWNKAAIELLADFHGIRTTFVFQPVPMFHYEAQYNPFAALELDDHKNTAAGYSMMAEYVASHSMGNNFLWLADMQRDLRRPLYCDAVHYTAEFSREIAVAIAGFLATRDTGTPSD